MCKRLFWFLVIGGLILAPAASAMAQGSTFGSGTGGGIGRNTGGGTFGVGTGAGGAQGNRLQGFEQTGALSIEGANRQAGAFSSAQSQNAGDFRSVSGGTGTAGLTGLGTGGLGGFGTGGLGGFGTSGLGGFGTSGLGGFGGGLGGLGGFGGIGGFGGRGFNQQGALNQGQTGFGGRSTLRTGIRVGFDYPISASSISTAASKNLANIPQLQLKSPVEVQMSGRKAILRGVVATESDRDLAERLALLEPGISEVQNELIVEASPASSNRESAQSSDSVLPPPPQ